MKKLLLVVGCCLLLALAFRMLRANANDNPHQRVVIPDDSRYTAAEAISLSGSELTEHAEVIITGRCVDTESAWIGRTLVTRATISVDETLKGEQAQTLTVVLPGGIDANRDVPIAMTFAGAPTIAPQEEVFLFLTREQRISPGYTVAGYSQGKFSIVEDQEGHKMISRDLTQVKLHGKGGVVRGTVQFTPLSEFKEKIKGYLRHQHQ